MEFNEQYLTYEDYKALGGKLEITPFNLLEFEARRQIDQRTFNRLSFENIPQEVKLCIFKLINSIESYANATEQTGNVASESIDGYSVSYIDATKVTDIIISKQNEIDDIIRTYLLGVIYNGEHLMYCGVK